MKRKPYRKKTKNKRIQSSEVGDLAGEDGGARPQFVPRAAPVARRLADVVQIGAALGQLQPPAQVDAVVGERRRRRRSGRQCHCGQV